MLCKPVVVADGQRHRGKLDFPRRGARGVGTGCGVGVGGNQSTECVGHQLTSHGGVWQEVNVVTGSLDKLGEVPRKAAIGWVKTLDELGAPFLADNGDEGEERGAGICHQWPSGWVQQCGGGLMG